MAVRSHGFRDGAYRVAWRLTPSEALAVHRLRADVFCRELKWVGSVVDEIERDEFDRNAAAIAVFDPAGEPIATVRLVRGNAPWMLDSVFRHLMSPGTSLERSGAAEASRLAVAPRARNGRLPNGRCISHLIYKASYAYCVLHGIHKVYMVTSAAVHRHMRSAGLPCQLLAPATVMPDGVIAFPVAIDWRALRASSPHWRWYTSDWVRKAACVARRPSATASSRCRESCVR